MRLIIFLGFVLFSIASYATELVKVSISGGADVVSEELRVKIEKNATALISAFNEAVFEGDNPDIDKKIRTKDLKQRVSELWESSPIACIDTLIEEKLMKLPGGGFQIRNISVSLLSAPEGEQNQEVVLNFTDAGLIDNIQFALDENRYKDIVSANISVRDFANRQVIVDFVENFRTAYNRKDIEYLKAVFSDDALIITGKVLKVKPYKSDIANRMSSERIMYVSQNKQQYMAGLERCFKRNKYIDVKFSDIEVLRHPVHDNIYGVTLKQDWKSSRYNDTGWLFLMIDFTDEYQPCIQVRTWQPEEFNGRKLSREEIFSLDKFNI